MSVRVMLSQLLVVGLLVSACGAGPSASGPTAPAAALTVEVKLTDALRMEPATLSVKPGQPIHFVVQNAGVIDHEFFLGDAAAQAAHGQEMMGETAMMDDEPTGIGLVPGVTKTLDHTFTTAGTYEAGCHVNDHYAAGMKMVITVAP